MQKSIKKSGYYGLTTLACLDKDYQTIITSVTTLIILTYSNKNSRFFNKKSKLLKKELIFPIKLTFCLFFKTKLVCFVSTLVV